MTPWIGTAQSRLCSALAHKLGHILLHDAARTDGGESNLIYIHDKQATRPAGQVRDRAATTCTSGTLIDAHRTDWMAWQAAYVSGAILMPKRAVRRAVEAMVGDHHDGEPMVPVGLGQMVDYVREVYLVSESAAYMRLWQMEVTRP